MGRKLGRQDSKIRAKFNPAFFGGLANAALLGLYWFCCSIMWQSFDCCVASRGWVTFATLRGGGHPSHAAASIRRYRLFGTPGWHYLGRSGAHIKKYKRTRIASARNVVKDSCPRRATQQSKDCHIIEQKNQCRPSNAAFARPPKKAGLNFARILLSCLPNF
jgi:hypothetical protein